MNFSRSAIDAAIVDLLFTPKQAPFPSGPIRRLGSAPSEII
jgi:hypothetical protein